MSAVTLFKATLNCHLLAPKSIARHVFAFLRPLPTVMYPQAMRRRLGTLLLGLSLLIGLAPTVVAQTFPSQTGVGVAPTADYIDLYYRHGQAITPVRFPAATGGTAPLTYSLAGGHASLGFSFDPITRTFSGTPTLAGAGSTGTNGFEFSYFVDEQGSGSDRITVYVTVCEVGGSPGGAIACTPPSYTAPTVTVPAAQSYTVDEEIMSFVLPAATGGTGTAPLIFYTLTGLPAGLSFDPATRMLSGTPTTAGGQPR